MKVISNHFSFSMKKFEGGPLLKKSYFIGTSDAKNIKKNDLLGMVI